MSYEEVKYRLNAFRKGVSFDEPSHTYYYKNRTMTSVTTAVGNCFPRFDRGGSISVDLAEKKGISVKELKAQWRRKGELGTIVHNLLDMTANGVEFLAPGGLTEEESVWVLGNWMQGKEFLAEGIKVLYTEFPVYNGEYSIAGTCDMLAYEDGKIAIWDWKTNDTIMDERVAFGKYGFRGLAHIPNTNFWHYALQLSVYRYCFEKAGFECGKLRLVHLTPEGRKVIELPYLSDEARFVMEDNL